MSWVAQNQWKHIKIQRQYLKTQKENTKKQKWKEQMLETWGTKNFENNWLSLNETALIQSEIFLTYHLVQNISSFDVSRVSNMWHSQVMCPKLHCYLTFTSAIKDCTSNFMQSNTWKTIIGNLSRWPPRSWRPQRPSPLSSSSIADVLPSCVLSDVALSSGTDANMGNLPPGPSWGSPSCWMVGLDHLVHTKKEKHSAMLHPFQQVHITKWSWARRLINLMQNIAKLHKCIS